MQRWKRFSLYLECAAVLAVSAVVLRGLKNKLIFNTTFARDLDRVHDLLAGHTIWFGPELSGGGVLPGPLYYYLMAGPLGLGLSWRNIYDLMFWLNAAGLLLIYIFARRYLSWTSAVLAAAVYIFSTGIAGTLIYFANPSFLPLPSAVIMISLMLLFADLTSQRSKVFLYTGLAFGLGVQLHLSILLFAAAALILQVLGPRWGLRRLRFVEMRRGLAAFVLTTLPFTLWWCLQKIIGPLGQQVPEFSGGFTSNPSVIDSLVAQSSGDISATPLELLSTFIWKMISPRDVAAFAVCAAAALWLSPKTRATYAQVVKMTVIAGVCALTALLPVIHMDRHRYLTCGAVAVILLWPLFAEQIRYKRQAAHAAIFALLVLVLIPREILGDLESKDLVRMNLAENTAIAKEIRAQTGWTYAEARGRLYFINSHPNQTLRYFYADAERENPMPQRVSPLPDGYYVVMVNNTPQETAIDKHAFRWLAKQSEPMIAKALSDGAITLGEVQKVKERIRLVPYFVKDQDRLPVHFHNRSEEYNSDQEQVIDELVRKAAASPKQAAVSVFNACPGEPSYCRVALSAESEDLTDPAKPWRVRVNGLLVALPARRFSPDWNQVLVHPYVVIHCDGRIEEHAIAEVIGRPTRNILRLTRHPLLAPFERTLKPGCRGRIEAVDFGFKDSEANSLTRLFGIGPKQSRVSLPL